MDSPVRGPCHVDAGRVLLSRERARTLQEQHQRGLQELRRLPDLGGGFLGLRLRTNVRSQLRGSARHHGVLLRRLGRAVADGLFHLPAHVLRNGDHHRLRRRGRTHAPGRLSRSGDDPGRRDL